MKSLYFSNRNLPKPHLNSPEHPPKSPSKIPWRSRQVDYLVTWVYTWDRRTLYLNFAFVHQDYFKDYFFEKLQRDTGATGPCYGFGLCCSPSRLGSTMRNPDSQASWGKNTRCLCSQMPFFIWRSINSHEPSIGFWWTWRSYLYCPIQWKAWMFDLWILCAVKNCDTRLP